MAGVASRHVILARLGLKKRELDRLDLAQSTLKLRLFWLVYAEFQRRLDQPRLPNRPQPWARACAQLARAWEPLVEPPTFWR